jgi:hypothetical protein
MFELSKKETKIFRKLNTPIKVQDFIHKIPTNWEKKGETLFSPSEVLRENKAHCMEAALLAAAIFWYHGQKPLILDLRATKDDYEHVIALFRQNGHWGAISKSNHNGLLYRDPIYRSIRELVMSYFNEYFLDNGKKTLRDYSRPFDLRKFGTDWVTSDDNLWDIDKALDKSPHVKILDKKMIASLRKSDRIEIKASNLFIFKP